MIRKSVLGFLALNLLMSFSISALPIRIGFMGDVMLGRMVNEKLATAGSEYVWGDVLSLLKNNDLNIANLETTFTRSVRVEPKVFNFKSDPKNVEVLRVAPIGVVNLANNHSLDFGDEGLNDTLWTLDRAGIKHVGAGENSQAAAEPVIVKRKGVRIGILGYTDNEPGWNAGQHKPGIRYIKIPDDVKVVQADIAKLRPQVDIVIVSLHWGPNMREYPSKEFVDFAHALIDAGADIIHGQSAHIVQGIERYKDRLIMYDTGDFIDDYAVDKKLHNDQSFLFVVDVEKTKIIKVELLPVVISNLQVNRASVDQGRELLRHSNKLSAAFNTFVDDDGKVHPLVK